MGALLKLSHSLLAMMISNILCISTMTFLLFDSNLHASLSYLWSNLQLYNPLVTNSAGNLTSLIHGQWTGSEQEQILLTFNFYQSTCGWRPWDYYLCKLSMFPDDHTNTRTLQIRTPC